VETAQRHFISKDILGLQLWPLN